MPVYTTEANMHVSLVLQAGHGYADLMALHHTLPVTRHQQRHCDQDQSYTVTEEEGGGGIGGDGGTWGRRSWRYAAPEHMDVLARLRAVSDVWGSGQQRAARGCWFGWK
jgi:hypothetical protein